MYTNSNLLPIINSDNHSFHASPALVTTNNQESENGLPLITKRAKISIVKHSKKRSEKNFFNKSSVFLNHLINNNGGVFNSPFIKPNLIKYFEKTNTERVYSEVHYEVRKDHEALFDLCVVKHLANNKVFYNV